MIVLPRVRSVRIFLPVPAPSRPGWSPEKLDTEVLGRSHRSKLGKARLANIAST
jgi:hypothetical protein